jgi:AcrR family transcriptional regulator
MSSAKSAAGANSNTRILDAALAVIGKRGGADVSMADIARAARISRQAVYLHFADRAALMLALVRHTDAVCGVDREIRNVARAPAGVEAMRVMVSMQARLNPGIWAVARCFNAVRRTDRAAERGWQDRLQHRLEGCRRIVRRLRKEGALKAGLSEAAAADLLWSITSLRTWEDLVLHRGWTAEQYEERMHRLLLGALTNTARGRRAPEIRISGQELTGSQHGG